MGCKVALIQDRGVLGGDGSSEVRVWAKGNIHRGKYPRIGEIIEEIADKAKKSPGTYEEFEDEKKKKGSCGPKRTSTFNSTTTRSRLKRKVTKYPRFTPSTIRSSQVTRFSGTLFVDATGHGTIGYLAGADHTMTEKGRMGMSNMWAWANKEKATILS